MNVVALHSCFRCKGEGLRRELFFRGEKLGQFYACDKCVRQTDDELTRVRPVFKAMLRCGVPRDLANDTMTFMLERLYPEDERENR